MTTREIVATFKEMYDADVLPTRMSNVIGSLLAYRLFREDHLARRMACKMVMLAG